MTAIRDMPDALRGGMSQDTVNAVVQSLGYLLRQALVYLLQAGRGSSICVEDTGDVSVLLNNGGSFEEEDKLFLNSNPVAVGHVLFRFVKFGCG